MLKTIFAACAALFTAGPARALSFQPVLDFSAGVEYGSLQGGDGSVNAPFRLLAAPLMAFGKHDLLAPVFLSEAKYREKPVTEEGEPFVSRVLFLARPGYKHRFGESGYSVSAFGSAKRAVSNRDFHEPWSLGLYDFEEFGAGLKLAAEGKLPVAEDISVEVQQSHKGFPNYHYPAPTGSKNYYVKDLNITKFEIEAATSKKAALTAALRYSLSQRAYTDAYLFRADGTLNTGALRSDLYHLAALEGGWQLGPKLLLNATLEFTVNQSNMNNFDSSFLQYSEDVQSFNTAAFAPGLTWLPQGDPKGHRVSAGYRGLYRQYAMKPMRNPNRSYTKGAQADAEHSLMAKGTWAGLLTRRLDGFLLADYEVARSNQTNNVGVLFNYDYFFAQLGLEFHL